MVNGKFDQISKKSQNIMTMMKVLCRKGGNCQYLDVIKGGNCQYLDGIKGGNCHYLDGIKGGNCQYLDGIKGGNCQYLDGVHDRVHFFSELRNRKMAQLSDNLSDVAETVFINGFMFSFAIARPLR